MAKLKRKEAFKRAKEYIILKKCMVLSKGLSKEEWDQGEVLEDENLLCISDSMLKHLIDTNQISDDFEKEPENLEDMSDYSDDESHLIDVKPGTIVIGKNGSETLVDEKGNEELISEGRDESTEEETKLPEPPKYVAEEDVTGEDNILEGGKPDELVDSETKISELEGEEAADEELKTLEFFIDSNTIDGKLNKREAKRALDEYAKEWGTDLNQTKTLEVMYEELVTFYNALPAE